MVTPMSIPIANPLVCNPETIGTSFGLTKSPLMAVNKDEENSVQTFAYRACQEWQQFGRTPEN